MSLLYEDWSEQLAREVKELQEGMRRRVHRDPDIADYKVIFKRFFERVPTITIDHEDHIEARTLLSVLEIPLAEYLASRRKLEVRR